MSYAKRSITAGLLTLCFLTANLCFAQETKTVPDSKTQITLSFAPVVKEVVPAVVNIYTRSRVQVQENASPFMNDPFFRQFFGNGFEFGGRPREQVISSLGSGVIVNESGMIVTSNHVVKDAQEIKVALADKREFDAKVVMRDPSVDLAFIKINSDEKLPYLDIRDSDTLEVGDLVLAVGNPFGVGQTVTSGIISALARKATGVSDYQFFIQTDAAINPGNSGGALVDMAGHLIGINTAIYSTSGASVGIGFAIPSNMVKSLMDAKVEGGHIVHPWLGIVVQPMTPEIAESLGLKAQGVIIRKIMPGSSLEKAGIKVGDVLIAVNGNTINNEHDLSYRLALAKVGESATFQIVRDSKPQDISVIMEGPPQLPPEKRTISGKNPMSGITVANLSPALAVDLGLPDPSATGVVVTEVGSNNELGIVVPLAVGDIILEVNGNKITSTVQLEKMLKASSHNWQINYQRGSNILTLTVKM